MDSGLPPGISSAFWSSRPCSSKTPGELDLGPGEAWIGGYDGVGLYEGNNKVPGLQNTSVHITTHRLLLISDGRALETQLSNVRQSEFYSGFMRSSPKITLTLGAPTSSRSDATPTPPPPVPPPSQAPDTWSCGVCGFANPGSASPTSKCQLCGVAYATSRTLSPPPSRASTPASTTAPTPTPTAPPGQIACSACTFLNDSSMSNCEVCGTALPKPRVSPTTSSDKENVVRLSFRQGGVREAYRRLKGVLSDKVWERVDGGSRPGSTAPVNKLGGIDAIMKTMTMDATNNDADMQDAFRDLEVLMVRASEMVRLAQSLNSKLSATGVDSDEDATLVRSSLVRLGLPAPALTQDMVRDERAYLSGLASELGSILTSKQGLMLQPGQGIIALDSVWGLWMRARGVALLPPSTLANLLPLLPTHTAPPIHAMALPSGLTVLYTPRYAPEILLARLVERMGGSGSSDEQEQGMSIIDIAAVEGLPIGLATQFVELIAVKGGIVRDDQASPGDGGTKWYRDIISSWPLDSVV